MGTTTTAETPSSYPPLSRNRNYILLWSSQTLSELGASASIIAFPLLVLAISGSAVAAGLVGFANGAARFATGVLAGALVDRWDRKKVLVTCEVSRAIAFIGLVIAIATDHASVPVILFVALIEGMFATLFAPAEEATLPRLVSEQQLPPAVAGIAARAYLGATVGPALGGFLFGINRIFPFVADAISYVVSTVAVLFIRVPPREKTKKPLRSILPETRVGLAWVWKQPKIRATFFSQVGISFVFAALFFVVIVVANAKGVPAGEVGLIATMLGVGGLAGAFVASPLQAKLGPYRSIVALTWLSGVLIPLIAVVPAGYWYGVLLGVMAFLTPTATSSVQSYQMLSTPDELRGRLSGTAHLFGGVGQSLGPLAGGLVVAVDPTLAVLACAAIMLVIATSVTVSPSLRDLPKVLAARELDGN
ncbi:Predicted arabinose efflux permease, MFS family [Amycolatopsis marina]|uniref:Predicted arabinose efflux permease, MFS family n=1 Tax=Amycolatopsis marina TaxID=490629 RepID=A0A1I0XX39_9PSEU|nr:MFS transporter [Amycolatopsis marina]SFB04728.1 Predicted arabinose efflux permease, MFS family [Amycolatopsis marina]